MYKVNYIMCMFSLLEVAQFEDVKSFHWSIDIDSEEPDIDKV